MGKILVLTSKEGEKKEKFAQLIQSHLKTGNTIEVGLVDDVAIEVGENILQVNYKDQNIKAYDLIFFRGIKLHNFLYASAIGYALKNLGVYFIDRVYANIGVSKSKLTSLIQISVAGLPIPKTLYLAKNDKLKNFDYIQTKLGAPFIAKELSLQRGVGVHLVKNQHDLDQLPKVSAGGSQNDYLFQEYIEKDHEYRILVLGDKIGIWEEKIATDPNEFRNNVALGAKEVFLDKETMPDNLKEPAILGAKVLDLQIAGVDLMTEKQTGKVYIIEINRGPGLTYDEQISAEFSEIAAYLDSLLP